MAARNGSRLAQKTDFVVADFTVAIDTREQSPFGFTGIFADAAKGGKPIIVPTEVTTLNTGDYSTFLPDGTLAPLVIERKSIEDLFGTLGRGRERFVRELDRMQKVTDQVAGAAFVVIEAGWNEVLFSPPIYSGLDPKTVFRSVIAWQFEFPGIHWWPCDGRRHAERVTFRLIERWHKERARREKVAAQAAAAQAALIAKNLPPRPP